MNIKKDIIQLALIGTQRKEAPKKIGEFLTENQISFLNTEEQILFSCSILNRIEKAEIPINKIDKIPPKSEDKEVFSAPKSIPYLYKIIDGTYADILPEFLLLLKKHSQNFPSELLPELLEQALLQPELRHSLEDCLGERGKWLANQNSQWQQFLPNTDLENWDFGSYDERYHIFNFLLKNNRHQEAIELLSKSWNEEGLKQKIQFLKILDKYIHIEHLSFVENLLNEKRKDLRQIAVKLLVQIDSSSLCKNIKQQLKDIFSIKKAIIGKDKLNIKYPEVWNEDLFKIAIAPNISWQKSGIKAGRIGQMIALTNPNFWTYHLNKSSDEIIELFNKKEEKEWLLQALVESTKLFKNKEFSLSLLKSKINYSNDEFWKSINISPLINNIENENFNAILLKGIKTKNELLEENSIITHLLKNGKQKWSLPLTEQLIAHLQKHLFSSNTYYWNAWHYKSILKEMAYQAPIEAYNILYKIWEEPFAIGSSWEKEVGNTLSILHFRKKMTESFTS